MKARVIKDYDASATAELAYMINELDSWDLIELNYTLDAVKLTEWYAQINDKFAFMRFNFNKNSDKLDIEVSKRMVEEGYCGYYCGPIDGITLAWPIERYEPLPPPHQCNPTLFPEVNTNTFLNDAKIMSKMRGGYFDEMINVLGEDAFRQMIITTHYPGMYIRQHKDGNILKLHIPVETNLNALFHFGENKERSHHMEVGKIYVLNTVDWHGTTNESEHSRSHIITRVFDEHLLKIMSI